jgi:hypothetical protein
LKRRIDMHKIKKVRDYEIVDLDVDYPDYFQGFGYYGTQYENAFYGIGYDAVEAYNDAVEGIASWFIVDALPKRPRGLNKRMKVRKDQGEDALYHVGIRFNAS